MSIFAGVNMPNLGMAPAGQAAVDRGFLIPRLQYSDLIAAQSRAKTFHQTPTIPTQTTGSSAQKCADIAARLTQLEQQYQQLYNLNQHGTYSVRLNQLWQQINVLLQSYQYCNRVRFADNPGAYQLGGY